MSKKVKQRQCQPCTGCCDGWLKINVQGFYAQPGTPCPHSTGKGCDDYHNRPVNPCRNFECGWVMAGSPLPEWFKPSNAKVIVVFNKLTYRGVPVDLAVPVGKRIPPRAFNWLKNFANTTGRPFVFMENTKLNGKYTGESILHVHGPSDFCQYVKTIIEAGGSLW